MFAFSWYHIQKGKSMAKKINYAAMFTLRKDGRYQGSYTDETGRHYLYDRDPEKLWHRINAPKEEKPILFSEIAQAWQESAWDKIRDGTKSCYDAPYQRAVDRFGKCKASEIEPHEISTHLQTLKAQGLSASTIKKQKIVYKQIFDFAITDKVYGKEVRYNPAQNVKMPDGLPKANQREAPEDDIVKEIRTKAERAYFGMFAFFLICTGFRRGEALAVQWKDIDFKKGTITCGETITHRTGTAQTAPPKTKNGYRSVPLLPALAEALERPQNAKDTDYVFYGEDPAKPMPQSTYDRRWMHYCKDMGFVTDEPEVKISKQGRKYTVHHYKPTLTAHDLRHGYATMLFEADVDVYTAKTLLGHADIETTMAIYTHLRSKKKMESIDKLKEYAKKAI
jgi:integrase